MKIIEAMKTVKMNNQKITDLKQKIALSCAHLSHEKPLYGDDTKKKVTGWIQSCMDLGQENIKLLCAIQRTNLATRVTIEIGGKTVTKTIAEWVWRRRTYAKSDKDVWSQLTDRGLNAGVMQSSTGENIEINLVRNYDPSKRDEMISMYSEEPFRIDSKLEVVNATTDIVE